jgi:hypothetical protein
MQVPVSPAALCARMRKQEIIAKSEVDIHESHDNYPYLRAFLIACKSRDEIDANSPAFHVT